MAHFDENQMELAGNFVLAELLAGGIVRYSCFNDGTDETARALYEAMGWPKETEESEDGRVEEYHRDGSAEFTLHEAAFQLERAKLVTIRMTGELLADGESDYEISLTEEGKSFLASGQQFHFRSLDTREAAVPTVAWRPPKDESNDLLFTDNEFIAQKLRSSMSIVRIQVAVKQVGAVDLGLGSAILVFGKRPPGVNDPQDALLRRELRQVQSGLVVAGAEELFHLVLGGGYLLLAKPFDLPLYDATTPVSPAQLGQESNRFDKVLDGLRALARQASDAVYGGRGSEPVE